jgi:hypothetical protein
LFDIKEPNVEIIESEREDDYSDDDLFNINSWGADLSFRELITMYEEDELIKPEMQRNYVWDKSEASRFIETLLMGLPVPSIFLAKVGEDKLIVDGYQRIMTVFDFVKGIFQKDKSIFRLSNSSKINDRWRGKSFSQLTREEQKRIRSTTIHAIIFEQKHPYESDTSLYQVFERINTGGRTLMPQEIRNCVYHNNINQLLIELNKLPKWRTLYGSLEFEPRMKDIELILRFFTLRSDEVKNDDTTQISLKKALNLYMGNDEYNSTESIEKSRGLFCDTIELVFNTLGENAFHNLNSKAEEFVPRFHPTIFDAISIATSNAIEKGVIGKIDTEELLVQRLRLLKDENFKRYISERTTRIDHINGRINLASEYLYGVSYV